MSKILNLISDYRSIVQTAVQEMQKTYQTSDLLKEWRLGNIPREGVLASGTRFEFHGVGCFITVDDVVVNFDFGPENRCDGFDAWRLSLFASEKADLYPDFSSNKDLIEKELIQLEMQGLIFLPKWFPGRSLYYFDSANK